MCMQPWLRWSIVTCYDIRAVVKVDFRARGCICGMEPCRRPDAAVGLSLDSCPGQWNNFTAAQQITTTLKKLLKMNG